MVRNSPVRSRWSLSLPMTSKHNQKLPLTTKRHATSKPWEIKSGPTFVLRISVLNLGIFRQTFFSRSLEFCLVLREKVIFLLRTTPAALGHVLSDQVIFSPKTFLFQVDFVLSRESLDVIFVWNLLTMKILKKIAQWSAEL